MKRERPWAVDSEVWREHGLVETAIVRCGWNSGGECELPEGSPAVQHSAWHTVNVRTPVQKVGPEGRRGTPDLECVSDWGCVHLSENVGNHQICWQFHIPGGLPFGGLSCFTVVFFFLYWNGQIHVLKRQRKFRAVEANSNFLFQESDLPPPFCYHKHPISCAGHPADTPASPEPRWERASHKTNVISKCGPYLFFFKKKEKWSNGISHKSAETYLKHYFKRSPKVHEEMGSFLIQCLSIILHQVLIHLITWVLR